MAYADPSVAGSNPLQLTSNSWNLITGYWGEGSIAAYDGADFNVLPITFTPGQWQKWEVDYEIGASTMTVTIDGNVATDVPVMAPGVLDRVTYMADRWGCWDEIIPEPSSFGLLSMGLLGLLAFGRHKRR